MSSIDLNLTLVSAVAMLGAATAYFRIRRESQSLPPGPSRLPIVGSLFSIPSNIPHWEWFAKLSKQTGSDIIHFDVLGSHTIVLNSREAVAELLERRSGLYSERPYMAMATELTGWGRTLGLADYATAREMRKLLLGNMNAKSMQICYLPRESVHGLMTKWMQEWRPQQEQEGLCFLQKCLRTPEQLQEHIRQWVCLQFKSKYTKPENDEFIAAAERAMDSFVKASAPGAFFVDVFPLLKYVPWAEFQRTAAMWRQELLDFVEKPMRFVHQQTATGQAEPSFVSKWLENADPGDDTGLIPWAAASLYAGGSDTTAAAVSSFFVAMLHYPSIQRKAQAEIDSIVGRDRLPTLADRASLPYVEGVYKEVYRWIPLGPIGVPHRFAGRSDDSFKGMRIPAGSTVIANSWAMFRDPEVYHDPTVFNPERYTTPKPEPDSEDIAFGFGRRRCPGILVAQSSIWISIALTLAAFDIEPFVGDDGKPELPSLDYDGAIVRHPKPFRCRITPRSEQARQIVEDGVM